MTVTDPVGALRGRRSRHESFLIYARFRYLKIACAATVVSIVLYLGDSPYGSRYGGSWTAVDDRKSPRHRDAGNAQPDRQPE